MDNDDFVRINPVMEKDDFRRIIPVSDGVALGIIPSSDDAALGRKLAPQPEEKSLTNSITELTSQPEPEKTSTRLYSGQQSIKSYYKSTKRMNGVMERPDEKDNKNMQDLKTSDTVTSEAGRKKLIMLGWTIWRLPGTVLATGDYVATYRKWRMFYHGEGSQGEKE